MLFLLLIVLAVILFGLGFVVKALWALAVIAVLAAVISVSIRHI